MTDPTAHYGYTAPHSVAPSTKPTGKLLLSASWELLKQDRDLLWLPVMATAAGLLALAVVATPTVLLLGSIPEHNTDVGVVVPLLLAGMLTTAVAIFFQVALVIGANERADGGDPTLSGVLALAWTKRRRILAWAALSATVGTAMRLLEERLGVIGKVIGFLGGVTWAIASFLVVPVLVAEDLAPIAAVQRSAQLIKETFGTSVRTTLRFGAIQLVLILPLAVLMGVGVAAATSGSPIGLIIGLSLVLLALFGVLAASMVFAAIMAYARALIYRFATGRPVPGIDPALFAGAFKARKRRSLLAR